MNEEKKYDKIAGVPDFSCREFLKKRNKYCVLIPVLNEGDRIAAQLERAEKGQLWRSADVILCDGGSTDGSMSLKQLSKYPHVMALLVKEGPGRQGAQLRMGFWWALKRGYAGCITIDGNNKDSIEDVPRFVKKLEEGYDFIQGSRFLAGGRAIRTPITRYIAVRVIHAPIISLTAGRRYTDTTNGFRAYSGRYLTNGQVAIFRRVFDSYELLAYLSVRASQLGMKTCEIPVTRAYPKTGQIPTKISFVRGNLLLLKILFINLCGGYRPKEK